LPDQGAQFIQSIDPLQITHVTFDGHNNLLTSDISGDEVILFSETFVQNVHANSPRSSLVISPQILAILGPRKA
jgi:hypothetical protein